MNLNRLFAILKVELTLLMRSMAVKLLWGVCFLVTLALVFLSHVDTFQPAIPGVLATKAFVWFSILRILTAPFIAPVFVHDDRKHDSFQSLSLRPFTNTEYLFGKLFGFTGVMLLADYTCMAVLLVNALFLPAIPFSPWPYLVYPLILTLPLCVFLFGATALAARIYYPLVYLLPVVFALFFIPLQDTEIARLFDLGGITLPLAYSAMNGFHEIDRSIVQRMLFLLGGLAFMLITTSFMHFSRRAGSAPHVRNIALILVLMIAELAVFLSVRLYAIDYMSVRGDPYLRFVGPTVDSCDLVVTHEAEVLDVLAHMTVTNNHDFALDQLYFKHGGYSTQREVSSEDDLRGERVRDFHVNYDAIVVVLNWPLEPGERMEIDIRELSNLKPGILYPEVSFDVFGRVRREGLTVLGKQTLYVEPEYVLLPGESDWFPSEYPQYKPSEIGAQQRPLTEYTLEVTTHDGLAVISQGEMTKTGENTYFFKPEQPLTQLSLTIGPYEHAAVDVDGVEYSYWWIGKNPFRNIDITAEQVERAIRSTKNEIEKTLQLEYPFKRYRIVETPIHFFAFNSARYQTSPYDQPEIRFIPEGSHGVREYRMRGQQVGAVEMLTTIVFPRLHTIRSNSRNVHNKLNGPSSPLNLGGWMRLGTDPFDDYANIISQYAVFARGPVSSDPYFNLMAVNWLRSKFFFSGLVRENLLDHFYNDLDEASSQFLSTKSLKEILAHGAYYGEWLEILNMASKTYFNLYAGKSGVDIGTVEDVLFDGFGSNGVDVAAGLTKRCGTDAVALLQAFGSQTQRSHYEISDRTVCHHTVDGRDVYNVRFKAGNPTPYDGLLECVTNTGSGMEDRAVIYLEPFSEKEIGLVASKETVMLGVAWLPFGNKDNKSYSTINPYNWPVNMQTLPAGQMDFFEGVRDVRRGTVPVSVVVDNLDEGCRVVSSGEKGFLRRFIENRRGDTSYVSFKNYQGLNGAPDTWSLTKTVSENAGMHEFYGRFSSCYETRPGMGDTAVEFAAPIPGAGTYRLFLSVPDGFMGQRFILPLLGSGELGETTVRVFAGDGIHEETVDISKAEEWAFVGTYSFPDTTAVMQITDKSNARLIIADAIKLSKVE